MKPECIFTIPATVQGIPCLIGVESVYIQRPFKGSPCDCVSDVDFYGYHDIEYIILDRKGYSALWLEKKLTNADRLNIEEKIMEIYYGNFI